MDAETGFKSGLERAKNRRDPIVWRDLRDWLAEVERIGELNRVAAIARPGGRAESHARWSRLMASTR